MIELKHLTKKYDHFLAVEDLNLKIETGEFFGLLGPNGAGKTTTIGMLSTLLLPTSGEIWRAADPSEKPAETKTQCRYAGILDASGYDDERDYGISGTSLLYADQKDSGAVRGIAGILRVDRLSEENRPKAFRRHEAEADGLPGTFNGTGNPSSG